MSSELIQAGQCCQPCPDVTGEQGPQGPVGPPGADGTDGTNGENAFSTTALQFTMPASLATVVVTLVSNAWVANGSIIYIESAGWFGVAGIGGGNQIIALNLGYPGNVTPGTIVAPGNRVLSSGVRGANGASGATSLNDISPTTTKGDLIVDNGANNPLASDVRFGVGSNGQVLAAQSGQPTGLQWQAIDMSGSSSSLTGVLPFARGGTSQNTQALAANKLGVRWTNVFGGGMAAVTPEFFNQVALDNDNNLWRGTSLVPGGWNGDIGVAGRFIAGGLNGAVNDHFFQTVSDNVIKVRNQAVAGHSTVWGDQCDTDSNLYQWALGVGNSGSGYPNLVFLGINHKDGITPAPDFVFAQEGVYYGDIGHVTHYAWYFNGTTLDYDFLRYQANTAHGPSVLHVDHSLGVTGFQSCSLGTYVGTGTLTISGAGLVTGAGGTTFLTDFLNNRVFVVGTDVYHVIKVTTNSSMQVAEPVSQAAGSAYTIYRDAGTFYGIGGPLINFGVHISGDGELLINGSSIASIYLQEQGGTPSSWRISSGNSTFSITDIPSNKGPFAIIQGAGNNSIIINADSSVNLATGPLKIAGTQVVSTRKTGWTIMTGTPQRGTFDTATITLPQLAGLFMALEQDIGITASGHGLINA